MKKKLLFTVALGALLLGCSTGQESTLSSQQSSSVEETSSSSFEKSENTEVSSSVEKESEIKKALEFIKPGFNAKAEYKYAGKTDTYKLDFTYLNGEEEGISYILSVENIDGFVDEDLSESIQYFKDEEGYGYQEKLTMDNTVEKVYGIDKEAFNATVINPFTLLNESDFSNGENGVYELDYAKVTFISRYFIEDNESLVGFTSATMKIENDKFTSFSFATKDYISSFKMDISYDDISLEHLKPVEVSEEQKVLQAAFKNAPTSYVYDLVDNVYGDHMRVYSSGKSLLFIKDADSIADEPTAEDLWTVATTSCDGDTLYDVYYDSGAWYDAYNPERTFAEETFQMSSLSGVSFDYNNGVYVSKAGLGKTLYEYFYTTTSIKTDHNYDLSWEDNLSVKVTLADGAVSKVDLVGDETNITITLSAFTSFPFGLSDASPIEAE